MGCFHFGTLWGNPKKGLLSQLLSQFRKHLIVTDTSYCHRDNLIVTETILLSQIQSYCHRDTIEVSWCNYLGCRWPRWPVAPWRTPRCSQHGCRKRQTPCRTPRFSLRGSRRTEIPWRTPRCSQCGCRVQRTRNLMPDTPVQSAWLQMARNKMVDSSLQSVWF